jgi:hypothetical protein
MYLKRNRGSDQSTTCCSAFPIDRLSVEGFWEIVAAPCFRARVDQRDLEITSNLKAYVLTDERVFGREILQMQGAKQGFQ